MTRIDIFIADEYTKACDLFRGNKVSLMGICIWILFI